MVCHLKLTDKIKTGSVIFVTHNSCAVVVLSPTITLNPTAFAGTVVVPKIYLVGEVVNAGAYQG